MSKIGKKIRSYRESLGLSRADFAAKLDEKPSKIQDVETGKQRINDIFLINLADKFPIDVGDLFRNTSFSNAESELSCEIRGEQNQENFIPIPRYSVEASAGSGALVETEAETGHYAFNAQWIKRRNLDQRMLNVITVRGDSMEPELYDQDLILLDRSQIIPRDGGTYVVRYSGDLFVKRVQVIPGNKLELLSTNRFYNPIRIDLPREDEPYDLDLEFIGKVIASMHEW